MLIKQADDKGPQVAAIKKRIASSHGEAKRRAQLDLRMLKAGIKGEADAAYLIDFDWGQSKNWFVIHDLRIEYAERGAQIDHLLVNRFLDWYVLETKHFHAGVKITEEGEFLRWNDFKRTYEGMASPLEQNERHIAVLRDAFATIDLPRRLGLKLRPNLRSLVLVSSKSRIDRPRRFDTGKIVKADQLRATIEREIKHESTIGTLLSVGRFVSRETVQHLAEQLAALHRPAPWFIADAPNGPQPESQPAVVPSPAPQPPVAETEPVVSSAPDTAPPTCKKCGSASGSILHGKFGYYFKCTKCAANTAIKFDCLPGHAPKLRKAGDRFYRDCEQCGSSMLYFVNSVN